MVRRASATASLLLPTTSTRPLSWSTTCAQWGAGIGARRATCGLFELQTLHRPSKHTTARRRARPADAVPPPAAAARPGAQSLCELTADIRALAADGRARAWMASMPGAADSARTVLPPAPIIWPMRAGSIAKRTMRGAPGASSPRGGGAPAAMRARMCRRASPACASAAPSTSSVMPSTCAAARPQGTLPDPRRAAPAARAAALGRRTARALGRCSERPAPVGQASAWLLMSPSAGDPQRPAVCARHPASATASVPNPPLQPPTQRPAHWAPALSIRGQRIANPGAAAPRVQHPLRRAHSRRARLRGARRVTAGSAP